VGSERTSCGWHIAVDTSVGMRVIEHPALMRSALGEGYNPTCLVACESPQRARSRCIRW
jgi:hypothetical protein